MARVLIADDDGALLEVLRLSFEDAGHVAIVAEDGRKALARIEAEAPDLVVCDVNMPGLDGFSVCRRVRERGNDVPFILLTSRDDEIDEALGFELGADDYVAKPCSFRVLLARTHALLRRNAARGGAPPEPSTGTTNLRMLAERLEARYRGTLLRLTVTEFRLLEALVRRPGVVLSRAQLLEAARGGDSVVVDRIIDTYVRRLRRTFEAIEPAFSAIETVVGVGYRWTEP
ncbi:MAG: response regulator transcription factor [Polyangiaceae bacterium]|nr:response regulator transcription factor [Polyangiaceae bacterium]